MCVCELFKCFHKSKCICVYFIAHTGALHQKLGLERLVLSLKMHPSLLSLLRSPNLPLVKQQSFLSWCDQCLSRRQCPVEEGKSFRTSSKPL